MTERSDITRLLSELSGGDGRALDQLMPLVYGELRRLARAQLSRERKAHTLDSVALVNEAYLRLAEQQQLRPENRAHFFGVASGAMRRILVDHARSKRAAKRGGSAAALPLTGLTAIVSDDSAEQILEVDRALSRLVDIDELACRVVECMFFGGLTYDEVAVALQTSASTVRRRWRFARSWLEEQLGGGANRRR